jgi:undecaprenyl-diphosphatase
VTAAVQATAQQAAETARQVTTSAQETAQHAATTARQVTETAQVAARRATVPVRLARRRGRFFLWVALGALAAFAGLAIVVHGHHQNSIDLRITQAVQREQRRRPWLATLFQGISTPGFAPWSWLGPIVTAGSLRWLGYRLESIFILGTGLASALVAGIKLVIARPRPSDPSVKVITQLKDYSFPSGHTIQYAAQFGYAAYLAFSLLRPGWLRNLVLTGCGALILLIAPSRIGMGHHWASDVLASYCLGIAFLIGHIALYRRLKDRQRPVAPQTSQTVPADEDTGGKQ